MCRRGVSEATSLWCTTTVYFGHLESKDEDLTFIRHLPPPPFPLSFASAPLAELANMVRDYDCGRLRCCYWLAFRAHSDSLLPYGG